MCYYQLYNGKNNNSVAMEAFKRLKQFLNLTSKLIEIYKLSSRYWRIVHIIRHSITANNLRIASNTVLQSSYYNNFYINTVMTYISKLIYIKVDSVYPITIVLESNLSIAL